MCPSYGLSTAGKGYSRTSAVTGSLWFVPKMGCDSLPEPREFSGTDIPSKAEASQQLHWDQQHGAETAWQQTPLGQRDDVAAPSIPRIQ